MTCPRRKVELSFRYHHPILIFLPILWFSLAACAQRDAQPSSGSGQTVPQFATGEIQSDVVGSPQTKPAPKSSTCPDLDSQLYQLIQLDDPAGEAAKVGMKVKGDRIQVVITLLNEDSTFLADFQVEIGTQSGNQVQAYVQFDQLCALANSDSVVAVNPAALPVP